MNISCFFKGHRYKVIEIINEHAISVECVKCHKFEVIVNPYHGVVSFTIPKKEPKELKRFKFKRIRNSSDRYRHPNNN